MQADDRALRQEEEERGESLSHRIAFTLLFMTGMIAVALLGGFVMAIGIRGFDSVVRHYADCTLRTRSLSPVTACGASTVYYAWSSLSVWTYIIMLVLLIWFVAVYVLFHSMLLCPPAVFVWPMTLRHYYHDTLY